MIAAARMTMGTAGLRRFVAIVQADLRERARATRFWAGLALIGGAVWWSFPAAGSSYLILAINGHVRGAYSSAWIGMITAMLLSLWLSLIGFYLVRGTLARDIETRVWQLLGVTNMTRPGYLLAKWCGNMAVLLLVALAALGVGLVKQWTLAEDRTFDLVELVKPVVLIALPALGWTAACAVWFDMLPWLRRTAGNVLYFVLWLLTLGLTVGGLDGRPPGAGIGVGDPHGMAIFQQAAHRQAGPQLREPLDAGFCMGCGLGAKPLVLVRWPRWDGAADALPSAAGWLMLALALTAAGAPLLDGAAARTGPARGAAARAGRPLRWLDRLTAPLRRTRTGALVGAELQRCLRERPLWWWIAQLAAAVAGGAAPAASAALAPVASWMLLLDLYARAAGTEREHRTAPLVFSAASGGRDVLVARWSMLVLLGFVATLPALVRFAFEALPAALALLAATLSLPTLALALGAATRGPRLFEVLMCLGAYLAFSHVPVLDVVADPVWTATLHAALLPPAAAAAWFGWFAQRRS
jgi:hypothetical protein